MQKCILEADNPLSSSKTTIRDRLIKHGVKLRSREGNEVFKETYGKRRKKYKTRNNRKEINVINLMLSLRDKGASYRKIALLLTELKIPTFCDGLYVAWKRG